jgi:hypothetical protein
LGFESPSSRWRIRSLADRLQDLAELEEDFEPGLSLNCRVMLQNALREMILAYRRQKKEIPLAS